MSQSNYKLEELAREAGTSARTVRYYVQRGLLPAPAFRGKDTGYGREHLVRLRAIKRLQEAYFPLDAIAAELASRSIADIERIGDGRLMPSSPHPHPQPQLTAQSPYRTYSPSSDREDELVVTESRQTRFAIAPGVELTLDDDAPTESRRLVNDLLASLQATSRMRGRR